MNPAPTTITKGDYLMAFSTTRRSQEDAVRSSAAAAFSTRAQSESDIQMVRRRFSSLVTGTPNYPRLFLVFHFLALHHEMNRARPFGGGDGRFAGREEFRGGKGRLVREGHDEWKAINIVVSITPSFEDFSRRAGYVHVLSIAQRHTFVKGPL